MSNVEFEEQGSEFHIKSRKLFGEPETPTMIRLLMKYRIAKDEKQAVYILIGIITIALLATFFIGFGGQKSTDSVVLPDGEEITVKQYIQGVKSGVYQ